MMEDMVCSKKEMSSEILSGGYMQATPIGVYAKISIFFYYQCPTVQKLYIKVQPDLLTESFMTFSTYSSTSFLIFGINRDLRVKELGSL
jgi:hypothetical protein